MQVIASTQPFWGRKANQLGVGTRPIPRGKLSAAWLTAALIQSTGDPTMREEANVLARRIKSEDDLRKTLKAFGPHLMEAVR